MRVRRCDVISRWRDSCDLSVLIFERSADWHKINVLGKLSATWLLSCHLVILNVIYHQSSAAGLLWSHRIFSQNYYAFNKTTSKCSLFKMVLSKCCCCRVHLRAVCLQPFGSNVISWVQSLQPSPIYLGLWADVDNICHNGTSVTAWLKFLGRLLWVNLITLEREKCPSVRPSTKKVFFRANSISSAIYTGSWQMTTNSWTWAQYLNLIGPDFWYLS